MRVMTLNRDILRVAPFLRGWLVITVAFILACAAAWPTIDQI
jgi:hypothetical protein